MRTKRAPRWHFAQVIVAIVIGALLLYGEQVLKDDGLSQQRLHWISQRMLSAAEQGEMVGGAGLIARNGRTVYQENYGYSDRQAKRPVRDDTLFRIYSMTKPITSVAVLMLYEQGLLSLKDPIADYLPELSNLRLATFTSEGKSAPERINDRTTVDIVGNEVVENRGKYVAPRRQPTVLGLLTHTAGFTYGIFGESEVGEVYRQAGLGDPALPRVGIQRYQVGKSPPP